MADASTDILLFKKAYKAYRLGQEPIMPDDEFDRLEKKLLSDNPHLLDECDVELSAELVAFRQTEILPVQMDGIAQVWEDSDIKRWNGVQTRYIASEKLDGVSVLLIYRQLKEDAYILDKAFSKHTGTHGLDITRHILKIPSIPKVLPQRVKAVRAEVIMSVKIFENHFKGLFKNPRNLVAGVLGRKDPAPEILEKIHCVAYSLFQEDTSLTKEEQLVLLEQLKFEVPGWYALDPTEESEKRRLTDYLLESKRMSPYQLDGLVLSTNNGEEDHRKFKKSDDDNYAITTVRKVEWRVHKDGHLRPRLWLDPIDLCGVTISHASGFNAYYIKHGRLETEVDKPIRPIGPGAVVSIVRSGDVIPDVQEVLTAALDPELPPVAEFGELVWDGPNLKLKNLEDSDEVAFKRLLYFYNKLDAKGVSESSLRKAFEAGFTTPVAVAKMSYADWVNLPGFAGTSAKAAERVIADCLENVDMAAFMAATNVFGRSVADVKLDLVVQALEGDIYDWKNLSRSELSALFLSLPGFAEITVEQVINGIVPFAEILNDFEGLYSFRIPEKTQVVGSSFAGQSVCFTGFRSPELEQWVVSEGGSIASGVTKKTTVLVAEDTEGSSGKLQNAKKLGIKIMSRVDLENLFCNGN